MAEGNATTYSGSLSQVKLPSGNIYEIKDAYARSIITGLVGGDAIIFKGVSTTPLTDGGNENPTVGGSVITEKKKRKLYF